MNMTIMRERVLKKAIGVRSVLDGDHSARIEYFVKLLSSPRGIGVLMKLEREICTEICPHAALCGDLTNECPVVDRNPAE